MKTLKNLMMASIAAGILIGCSDVGFHSLPSPTCTNFNNGSNQTCVHGTTKNTYSVTFHTGDVDILIVNDNSGSMSVEQNKMSERFPNFLSSISHLFYQIGMITTDVSGGNEPYQNGRLLEFTYEDGQQTGEYFLSRNSTDQWEKFKGTIRRQETLLCDANNYQEAYCPSSDERGIYALNLALDRASHSSSPESKFFRPGAHLAVVILSDEDERSTGGLTPGYPLEGLDYPETFLAKLQSKYPSKTVSVHAVIVQPNDMNCLIRQEVPLTNGFFLRGYEGYTYAQLAAPQQFNPDLLQFTNLTGGVLGSICANDYGDQLGNIGSFIADNARHNIIQMPCLPEPNDLNVTTNSGSQLSYSIDSDNRIIFSDLPMGVEVTVTYKCPAYL